MNNNLQLLVSTLTVFVGILIVFFYTFFEKDIDSNRGLRTNQNVDELRRTDLSQTTRILHYIYIALILVFLAIIYFIVPRQNLKQIK